MTGCSRSSRAGNATQTRSARGGMSGAAVRGPLTKTASASAGRVALLGAAQRARRLTALLRVGLHAVCAAARRFARGTLRRIDRLEAVCPGTVRMDVLRARVRLHLFRRLTLVLATKLRCDRLHLR